MDSTEIRIGFAGWQRPNQDCENKVEEFSDCNCLFADRIPVLQLYCSCNCRLVFGLRFAGWQRPNQRHSHCWCYNQKQQKSVLQRDNSNRIEQFERDGTRFGSDQPTEVTIACSLRNFVCEIYVRTNKHNSNGEPPGLQRYHTYIAVQKIRKVKRSTSTKISNQHFACVCTATCVL
jgi:hypothetical protein